MGLVDDHLGPMREDAHRAEDLFECKLRLVGWGNVGKCMKKTESTEIVIENEGSMKLLSIKYYD